MSIESTVETIARAARRAMTDRTRRDVEDRWEALRPKNRPGEVAEHHFLLWDEPHVVRESHGVVLSLSRRIPWHGTTMLERT